LLRKGKGRISGFHGTILIYPFTPTGDFQGWLLAREALEVQLHYCFSVLKCITRYPHRWPLICWICSFQEQILGAEVSLSQSLIFLLSGNPISAFCCSAFSDWFSANYTRVPGKKNTEFKKKSANSGK